MAAINTKNIHRSNALFGHAYGTDFQYDEMMVTGIGEQGKKMAEIVASTNPLVGDDYAATGEGPSREAREAGDYDIWFIGTDADGNRLKSA